MLMLMPALAIVVLAALVLAAVVLAAVAGCAGDGQKPGPTRSKHASASASPSASMVIDPTSGGSVSLDSKSKGYDTQLGGIYQAVGLEVSGSGSVSLRWVAGGDAAATPPTARFKSRPGVLEVWLSDLRPHLDLMKPVRVAHGPVESVAFVAPADDSLMILRVTMRDSSTIPKAAIDVSGGDQGSGAIDVLLHD